MIIHRFGEVNSLGDIFFPYRGYTYTMTPLYGTIGRVLRVCQIGYMELCWMSLLGDRLKQARERRKFTQAETIKTLGLGGHSILSRYERGLRDPDPTTLARLANLYDVSVDWLVGRTIDPTPAREIMPENVQPIFRRMMDMTPDLIAEMDRYSRFLLSERGEDPKKGKFVGTDKK